MSETKQTPQNYGDDSIQVLEGLEAVRKRPGMYIGSTDKRGLHHLVYEIFDNAVDEALSGFGNKIEVCIKSGEDGKVKGKNDYITVRDLGRGVPTGTHATGKPTAEVIFTVLHAGGKFGQGGYKSSGGLHGVGSSVVNALSSYMSVRIWRDGVEHFIEFENGGHPIADKKGVTLHKIGKSSEPTGTLVTFQPDPTMFSHLKYSFDTLAERLRSTAFLMKGMEIVLRDERDPEDITEEQFLFHEGLGDFVRYLNTNKKTISPVKFFEGKDEETGIEADIAIQWNDDYSETILSFVNNVRTVDGGTHETGFKSAITKALNTYAKDAGLIKGKNAKSLEGGDIREGLVGIVSVRVPEEILQFEGQTKGKLGTTEARGAVDTFLFEKMSHFFVENPSVAEDLINKALKAQKIREDAKKLRDEARNGKKKKTKNILLEKLETETVIDKTKGELYIVEGDSAGGSAKKGRDRQYQAILPLRGKVLNTQNASLSDALKNAELNTIKEAINAGIGAEFDPDESRYAKVVIMTDADTDGAHIQCLLLTFFIKFMPKLVEAGKLYIAQPPLFRIEVKGKTRKEDTHEDFWTPVDLRNYIKENKLTKDRYTISRFKGLGEMNADQLWETTMDPENRVLIQVSMDDKVAVEKILETLMGKDASPRKKWINSSVDFDLEEAVDELV